MRNQVRWVLSVAVACGLLAGAAALASAASGTGSLLTAEFPDVVEFDFEKVTEHYEKASEDVGQVTPVLDATLERGQKAVEAGETALRDPSEDNTRRFVAAVMDFVGGAADGKARIAELWEDVRAIHAQTGILYAQATTQTQARVEGLRKEFEREELKYRDIVTRNKARRREEKLNDWELRQLFEEERRQSQTLNRLSDRVAFQQDFIKALQSADGRSLGDFTLYEQFFAEVSNLLTDMGDLASNLPTVVERLQMASAMAKHIPSREAAVAGFAKIEQAREMTKKLAEQLMQICSGDLTGAKGSAEQEQVIIRQTEQYKKWLGGESLDYKRPPRASK